MSVRKSDPAVHTHSEPERVGRSAAIAPVALRRVLSKLYWTVM